MERVAIVSNCKPQIYDKTDISGIKVKEVSEYICETHYMTGGTLTNIITRDSQGNFYLYDCSFDIPKRVSRANSPLKLKGRRI